MEFLKKQKVIYTVCSDLIRSDGFTAEDIIRTHAISKKTAEKLSHYLYSTKFTFGKDNKLTRVQTHYDGELVDEDLNSVDKNITYKDYVAHDILFFKKDINGLHQIGGKSPDNFNVVNTLVNSSFQFIASISRKDPVFSWLPMDGLHIVYPLYVGSERIYFDYSDPASPVVIDIGDKVEYQYNFIDTQTVIEFETIRLSLMPWNKLNVEQLEMLTCGLGFHNLYGHTGVPAWVQYSTIPRCPISNQVMQFVCQIDTSREVKLSQKLLKPDVIPNYPVKEYLDFYGHGTFYIFIEPTTKIVCCLIQNT